jgi:hypothetical protein
MNISVHKTVSDLCFPLWWGLYSAQSDIILMNAIQSKPIFSFSEFRSILKDSRVLKVELTGPEGQLLGFCLLTKHIFEYDNCHLAKEYFSSHPLFRNYPAPLFFIGDASGFTLSNEAVILFSDPRAFSDCLHLVFTKLEEGEQHPILLVGNYSKRVVEVMGYKFLGPDLPIKILEQFILDKEIFSVISFKRFSKYKIALLSIGLKRLLKGRMTDRKTLRSGEKTSQLVVNIANKFRIYKEYKLNEKDTLACLHIYKTRLEKKVSFSPQVLLYDDVTFKGVMSDDRYIKYIAEDADGVAGLLVLIPEKFSNAAEWVMSPSRVFNGYIKLVLTRPGAPALYLSALLLFSFNDYLHSLKAPVRILLDYSQNINGDRFDHDLGSRSDSPVLNFFQLIKKNGFFAEFFSTLIRPKSEVMDVDYYLLFRRRHG